MSLCRKFRNIPKKKAIETQLVAHCLPQAKSSYHYLLPVSSCAIFCSSTDSETMDHWTVLLNFPFVAWLDKHQPACCLDVFPKLSWDSWVLGWGVGVGGWGVWTLGVDFSPAVVYATQQHLAASAVSTHITTLGLGFGTWQMCFISPWG